MSGDDGPSSKLMFGLFFGMTVFVIIVCSTFSYMCMKRRAMRIRERADLERQIQALRQRREQLLTKDQPCRLEEEAIESLPRRTVGKDSTGSNADEKFESAITCGVCLDDYKAGDVVIQLQCTHQFHDHCIVPWFRTADKCPFCNRCARLSNASTTDTKV
ncbi:hypothetical protein DL89DRAFT_264259 [Linderina pennispora]|uniref:RING-type domain-containing protein n=1 Tax=Linderina pennispora TaxID=61395 RepID=A0A1Y1WML6_9FUNG|nr:uncharacterized protein DL89DRAFT_264259 [Linderina pennispora]ORX74364.1 hypothetical protein DL89DRAFT_264259 [Linderina pennispora]